MAADGEEIPFDYEARRRIASSLARWARVHPEPDRPVLEAADGRRLTPRLIATAVRDPGSRTGSLVYSLFAVAVEDEVRGPHELEQILGIFDRDAQRWARRKDDGFGPPEKMQ